MADKPKPCARCGLPVQTRRPCTTPICLDCRWSDRVYVNLVKAKEEGRG